MGYTLDQLLDATGVSDISGERLTKQASAEDSDKLSKLAARCRRAVDATPDEHVASNQRELAEKTAAVAIIGRTLAEIDMIDGASPEVTKTASAQSGPSREEFIKTALEAGHSPQQIAEFMQKTALLGGARRAVGTLRAQSGYNRAAKQIAKGKKINEGNFRHWQQLIRDHKGLPPAKQEALVSKMRKQMGDESTAAIFRNTNHSFKGLDSMKDLMKSAPKPAAAGGVGPGYKASVNVGGSTLGVTDKQLKAAKKPALYAGAGYMGHKALTGGGDNKKSSGRGPVIITG